MGWFILMVFGPQKDDYYDGRIPVACFFLRIVFRASGEAILDTLKYFWDSRAAR